MKEYSGIEYDKGFFDGYDYAEKEMMMAFIDLDFEQFKEVWLDPFMRKNEKEVLCKLRKTSASTPT